jgi:lysyl-tRNA synthetase class 2
MAQPNPVLHARARIMAAVRAWFAKEGFVEADVGALALSPGAEVHTHAFQTQAGQYLHTSPEFAMKRLLAAGEDKIVFLGKVYRAGEEGPLHAPEFTMLEWYRAQAPYEAVMADALAVARLAAEIAGAERFAWKGRVCDPFAPEQRLTVRDAFARHANISPPQDPDAFAATLVAAIEPHLGSRALTLLTEYPLSEAALARRCEHDPTVAERFELYAAGVELANGYGELTDPVEQRARLEEAMAEKARRYGDRWPIDEAFLQSLAAMPPASGCALGFDRLVMLALHAPSLRHVLWAPPA